MVPRVRPVLQAPTPAHCISHGSNGSSCGSSSGPHTPGPSRPSLPHTRVHTHVQLLGTTASHTCSQFPRAKSTHARVCTCQGLRPHCISTTAFCVVTLAVPLGSVLAEGPSFHSDDRQGARHVHTGRRLGSSHTQLRRTAGRSLPALAFSTCAPSGSTAPPPPRRVDPRQCSPLHPVLPVLRLHAAPSSHTPARVPPAGH